MLRSRKAKAYKLRTQVYKPREQLVHSGCGGPCIVTVQTSLICFLVLGFALDGPVRDVKLKMEVGASLLRFLAHQKTFANTFS